MGFHRAIGVPLARGAVLVLAVILLVVVALLVR